MPARVGNGADLRREQSKQIVSRGFTQCPPELVMAQTRAESNINQAGFRALPNTQLGGWVTTQTRSESRENRLACRALPTAHQGVNSTDLRREQRNQIALQGFTQCPPVWVMAQMYAESRDKQTALQSFTKCPPVRVMAQTRAESK